MLVRGIRWLLGAAHARALSTRCSELWIICLAYSQSNVGSHFCYAGAEAKATSQTSPWALSIERDFGRNPLIDRRGKRCKGCDACHRRQLDNLTFVWSTPADTTTRENTTFGLAFQTQHQNSTLQAAQIVFMPTPTDHTLFDLAWCRG